MEDWTEDVFDQAAFIAKHIDRARSTTGLKKLVGVAAATLIL